MVDKKIKNFTKIYPWYAGLTGDLLFYIAIDTLFLTVVKNFSEVQIVSLTTISMFTCIVIQFPLLWIIERIGNTASARTGAFLLLCSALLITFGPNFYSVVVGKILHDVATVFRHVSYVTLENNLELIDRREDYTKVRTNANTVYAVLTMLIAFVASIMFNHNPYLPMFGCITTCTIGFVLSLFIVDYSDYDKAAPGKVKEKTKISFSKLIILALVVYGTFYPFIYAGQAEGKLFIQQQLLLDFDVDKTSLILGAMIAFSRIVRVFSNLVFNWVYTKYREKVGIFLSLFLCSAIGFMLFGSLVPAVVVKIILMSMGYCIILFIRDPFTLFMQDVVLNNTQKEYHRTILTLLQFASKIGYAIISFGFTCVLLKFPLITVIGILFVLTIAEIVIFARLYKLINAAKVAKETSVAQ